MRARPVVPSPPPRRGTPPGIPSPPTAIRVRARAALLALVVVAAPARLPATQLPAAAQAAWADVVADWEARLEREGVVGASLALIHGPDDVALATRGVAQRAAESDDGRVHPVDDETIYHWASITKTFTAISILQLRDRGLISLDDPIVRHVPELRGVHDPFGAIEDVTIRHLLSHTAGFRGSTWPWGGGEEWHPHEPTEWSQLVAMIPYTRLHFPPGERFSYSNPGIVWLGRVIEAVTGDVFEAYVDKNVFRPLGMRRAYFDTTPWHLRPHRSDHYRVGRDGPRSGGLDFNTGITVSNGGLNAPVGDMARYVAFLLGTPRADQDADAVLARSSLEEMWRSVADVGDSSIGPERMGLSFFLYDAGGRRLVGHTGTQRAFYSFMILDPEARVGALGAFNSVGIDGRGPDTARIRDDVRRWVVERVFPAVDAARAEASR